MKRFYIYIGMAAAVLCGVAATGCHNDAIEEAGHEQQTPDVPEGEWEDTVLTTFSLSLTPMISPSLTPTRATAEELEQNGVDMRLVPADAIPATRTDEASATVDENRIDDIWILQFDAEGKELLARSAYITLDGTTFRAPIRHNRASRIYLIANTHDPNIFKWTSSVNAIESATKTITSLDDLIAGGTLPMFGYVEGTFSGGTIDAEMHRSVVKVRLNINNNNSPWIGITGVRVCNVPKQISLFYRRDEFPKIVVSGGTTGFPVSTYPHFPAMTVDWAAFDVEIDPEQNPIDAGFIYLPANVRGNYDGGTLLQRDITADKIEEGEKATYIELALTRGVNGHTADYGDRVLDYTNIKFKLYLGRYAGDYNLVPNYLYNMECSLSNAYGSDPRTNSSSWTYKCSPYGIYYDNLWSAKTDEHHAAPWTIPAVRACVYDGSYSACVKFCESFGAGWGLMNPDLVMPYQYGCNIVRIMPDWWEDIERTDTPKLHVWYNDNPRNGKYIHADYRIPEVPQQWTSTSWQAPLEHVSDTNGTKARTCCVFYIDKGKL